MGFNVPRGILTDRKMLVPVWDIINSVRFKARDYWNWKIVHKMFRDTVTGKRNWTEQIWKLLFLELWLEVWLDNPTVPVGAADRLL